MTQSRLTLCAAIGLILASYPAWISQAQTAGTSATTQMRAQAAAKDWDAGAARRAALRSEMKREADALAASEAARIASAKRAANAKRERAQAVERARLRQVEQDRARAAAELDLKNSQIRRAALRAAVNRQLAQEAAAETATKRAAAKQDLKNSQLRRAALRATVNRQLAQEAAAEAERKRAAQAEVERVQREMAAADNRRRAAAKRAQLRTEEKRQAALEAAARRKAIAKAKAIALATKRAREKALAERAKAEAEVKARLLALEKARAAEITKQRAAAAAKLKLQLEAAAKAKADAARRVVIATWGGGYGKAQRDALFTPFENKTGLTTTSVRHSGGGMQELAVKADVINLSSATQAQGCQSGKLISLEKLDLVPAPGNKPVSEDLIDGARTKCGVASMAWSHVLLVRSKSFKRRVPTSLKHVFNVRRYPGKRAFVKSPRHLLEMALMADGVKPADVYKTLATYEGQSRALAKLEPSRGHIVWISRASEAYDLIRSGKVAIASGYSGRAFRMVTANPGIKTIWDGQIYDVDYWAIPSSSQNKEGALRFIRYATAPKSLAANARHFPYGPMRKSAVAMTGRHNILDIDLMPYLPTSKRNLRSALRFNASWWAANEEQIRTDPWFEKITSPLAKASKRKSKSTSKRSKTKTANSKSKRKRSTE